MPKRSRKGCSVERFLAIAMSSDDTVPKETKEIVHATYHFRARPWPVVVGGHVDLNAKQALYPSTNVGNLSSFAEMVDCLESKKSGLTDLFDDPRWRKRMWGHCEGSGASNDFMTEDADDEFLELEYDMRLGDEWGIMDRPHAAERELLEFLMEHDLKSLEILLDDGLVCGTSDIFEAHACEWQSFGGGEPESLLAMAAKHVGSPEAVRMLLARGADPNSELVHLSFNEWMQPTYGPGALACNDVGRHWCFDEVKKVAILTALGEAGGEMFHAYDAYCGRKGYEVESAACSALFRTEQERKSVEQPTKRRIETVVALVGIVSYWRRVAAAPDSKAAKATIARLMKRARDC